MIARHVPMKEAKLSSYAGLAKYITNAQEKQERVGEVRLTNFQSESLDWAITEALHVQQRNQRAEGDKTYHLLISFAPGEQPSADVLRNVEDRICAAIGFAEHQRVSAVHHDTDNLHIHIAINKIHPERHTIHEPYRAYQTMGDMAAALEREHGLQVTNHTGKKRGSENRADDMEQHAGIESLLGWIKRECANQLSQAQTWNDLHEVMRKNGLELQERGSGLVITDGKGIGVKASSVSRNLSKPSLEKRLGAFEVDAKRKVSAKRGPGTRNRNAPPVIAVGGKPPLMRQGRLGSLSQLGAMEGEPGKRYEGKPIHRTDSAGTTELYARYKAEQGIQIHARTSAWGAAKARKDKAVEAAKRTGRLKRAAIKLFSGPGVNKKLLYALVSKALHAGIQKANAQYMAERQTIHGQYSKKAWADWLQSKAKEGDQDALKALRGRKGVKPKTGDAVAGSGPVKRSSPMPLNVDSVTKDGTVIHRFGRSAIRDDGEALQVARGSGRAGLEAVLRMAIHRYGENIAVNGSPEFKEKIAQVAATSNLKITFNDPALEARRQELVRSETKENGNDRSRKPNRDSDERGRAASGNDGAARAKRGGTTARTRIRRGPGQTNKPGTGGIGARPPSMSGNSLRELPELGVVRIPERSEVLLPRDVSHNVQHEGAKHAGGVRRDLSGARGRVSPSPRGPGATNKPGVIPVGGKPPAMLRGRLQPMSKIRELPMEGSAGVPQKPQQQPVAVAAERNTPPKPQSAADKYIAERTSKRAKGFDIPNHRGYTESDKGAALFAGMRQIDGETLALLKRDEEIIVLPVDAATARRIKRYSLGDAVTLNGKGAVTKKGRSR
ncbi:TraI/MobA(P) family conjugative relaxase [Pseudomonas sp. S2.OTC.A_B10]|uniref:TraI/MobA(P) family conjugative relaxase n=1 Tax=Pseudomonas sp. S2.OTC.A_B10 TaxID=3237018 RepID=UPI003CF3915B